MVLTWLILGLISSQICFVFGTPISDQLHQNAGFLDKITNWFNNMKQKIFGTSSNYDESFPPLDVETFKTIEEDRKNGRLLESGNFFIDVSTISFDPQKDWGFHLGNWYVIKKNSDAGVSEIENVGDIEEATDGTK